MLVLSTDRIGYIDGLSCKRWIVEPCLDRSSILLTSTRRGSVELFFIKNEFALVYRFGDAL